MEPTWSPADIPLDTPNAARMYDYLLGGYHNFGVDRAAAEKMMSINPEASLIMQVNRAFLRRVVTFLVEQGIEQFLDLGSGIPTVGNVHEVAQRLNPDARVVYVDIDPVAVRHSSALLADNPNAVAIQADVREPEQLLHNPVVQHTLDFQRPVAVLLLYLLHFIPSDEQAYRLVRALQEALPAGSFMAISHGTNEHATREHVERLEGVYARSSTPVRLRSEAQIGMFLEGLNLIAPGLVYSPLWRPEGLDDLFLDNPLRSATICAVGSMRNTSV